MPDQFWTLTPFAFGLFIEGHSQKLKREMDQDRWAVWHMAALTRAKKITPFKEFMRPDKKPDKVGIDELAIKARLKAHNDG